MYEYLEGEVALRSPARLVLDVGGVGYDLAVPVGARFESEGRLRAWTHLVVREDAQLLFGFPDRRTRELFRLLLSVRGVGPQMALGVLSALPREELLAAIAGEDPAPFTRARGVGKKTAQQILLDLKDRIDSNAAELGATEAELSAPSAGLRLLSDAAGALVSLGYSDKEARNQVERAVKKNPDADLEEIVRAALRG